jgi:hypothetical protein
MPTLKIFALAVGFFIHNIYGLNDRAQNILSMQGKRPANFFSANVPGKTSRAPKLLASWRI